MAETIMVVDDDPDMRTTTAKILEKEGYTVVLATSAKEALEKLKTVKPALILFDIMMPGMPVKEVVKQITDVKISFLSTVKMSDAEKEELLKQPNIVDFIQKPFDINDLIARVKKAIGK